MIPSPISERLTILTDDPETPRIEYQYRAPQVDIRDVKGGWLSAKKEEYFETFFEATLIFNLRSGYLGKHPMLALTPFEVVDTYQFHGRTPYVIKDLKTGQLIGQRPTTWEIATANKLSGERSAYLMSCANKNEVFRVAFKINNLLAYCQKVLSPFAVDLKESEETPIDELHEMIASLPPEFEEF